MGDLKTRLAHARQKLMRKNSATTSSSRSIASSAGSEKARKPLRKSVSMTRLPEASSARESDEVDADQRMSKSAMLPLPQRQPGRIRDSHESGAEDGTERGSSREEEHKKGDRQRGSGQDTSRTTTNTTITTNSATTDNTTIPASTPSSSPSPAVVRSACPEVVIEQPTPVPLPVSSGALDQQHVPEDAAPEATSTANYSTIDLEHPSELPQSSPTAHSGSRISPPEIIRRQSLVTTSNARIIKTLLEPEASQAALTNGPPTADYFAVSGATLPLTASMLHRKIWVKRPNASATLVQIREDDLVDDVRDMILKKYANSLGKSFDAPDVVIRIHPRDSTSKAGDRLLGPEEDMCRTLDAYYPGGQSVTEALLIEVPHRRTPKPSPRIPLYYSHHDDSRPVESASEYFPPMPIVNPSAGAMAGSAHDARINLPHAPHSISVLQTGQLPPLPSPGTSRRAHHSRPKYPRHNTASPTTLTAQGTTAVPIRPVPNRPRHDSSASETKHSASSNPIPTPPAPLETVPQQTSTPPTPRVASPRPEKKRKKPKAVDAPSLPAGLLDGSVPPINVLIVEDNIINLKVLGAFMQRLKVRWQKALNGKEAVEKWRAGGFHLVLMDIQLPIMNGLEATKEIRRLERVNSIGVFSSGSSEAPNNRLADGQIEKEAKDDDILGDKSLFKSPVIIVALTASSLQSDRHEALAAGCNDFLTKPVNFVWLERKVKEWGCMQALIDFDGWRKWKDFAPQSDTKDGMKKLSSSYHSVAPRHRNSTSLLPSSTNATGKTGPTAANGVTSSKSKEEDKKNKRRSVGVIPPPVLPEEDSGTGTPDVDSSGG
ncbi:hypothetical protein BU24DRAFT_218125 [Aaosphaeria arxii CBS 175.79]|uniref:Response regulatory domain-containing protein n=1 Tax=Aaosphaeria arxii CBS 175.79 TaxID=1450172 RepID=A0A6A5XNX5_9PLEO|nr:uncharacterized protein BU24DRAFT_218125 [Aaosphaeria arxii CBS 175.79]KAF2014643.1 hypothetical protein BU24DRAFT_218125 [Aaosphaeria arxii CBS 175.79]